MLIDGEYYEILATWHSYSDESDNISPREDAVATLRCPKLIGNNEIWVLISSYVTLSLPFAIDNAAMVLYHKVCICTTRQMRQNMRTFRHCNSLLCAIAQVIRA